MNKIIIIIGVLISTGIFARDLQVISNLDNGSIGTLRYIIDTAASGDRIHFLMNQGDKIVLQQGPLTIKCNVVIDGKNLISGKSVTLNGNQKSRVLVINKNVKVNIDNLYITSGFTDNREENGGGIYNNGVLTLQDCIIDNCTAANGGGICNTETGFLILKGTTINNCIAKYDGYNPCGGGICNRGNLTIKRSSISSSVISNNQAINTAEEKEDQIAFGGGIYNDGNGILLINDETKIHGNYSSCYGGGIFNGKESVNNVKIENVIIKDNSCENSGGGLYNANISSSEICNNTAGWSGGGIEGTTEEKIIVDNCLIHDNRADFIGAGGINLYNGIITNSTISENHGTNGGGIGIENDSFHTNEVEIINSSITNNTATIDGGGVCSDATLLKVIDCKIKNNTIVKEDLRDKINKLKDNESSALQKNKISEDDYVYYGGGFYLFTFHHPSAVKIIGKSEISGNKAISGGNAIAYHEDIGLTIDKTVILEGDIKKLPKVN